MRTYLAAFALVALAATACGGSGGTMSSSRTSTSVIAATDPPPVTTAAGLTPQSLGPLALQISAAAVLCDHPNPVGVCIAKTGALATAVTAICDPYQDVVKLADAAGADTSGVELQGIVPTPTGKGMQLDQLWSLTDIRCAWKRTNEVAPIAGIVIGLVWRPPVVADCTPYAPGTCTQVTPRLLRIVDPAEHRFYFRVEGVLGGAQIDANVAKKPTAGQIADATAIAKTIADKLLAAIDV